MNLRRTRAEEPEISLTPLIDVVFTILIFFVITTTFAHEESIKLTLPQADVGTSPRAAEQLELSVDADGEYYLNGRALANRQVATVTRALEEAVREHPDRPVVLRADAKTEHQAVVTALEAAGRAGIKQISFATVTPTDGP